MLTCCGNIINTSSQTTPLCNTQNHGIYLHMVHCHSIIMPSPGSTEQYRVITDCVINIYKIAFKSDIIIR